MEHIAEALKEVMLELEPMAPTMKKYRKYLQRQNTDDNNITTNQKCNMASAQKLYSRPPNKSGTP